MGETSFTRWQGRSIVQMGYFINTLLILSTASVGFVVSQLMGESDFSKPELFLDAKARIYTGTMMLSAAICILLATSLTRLFDFKLTARIARKREKNDRQGIELLRDVTKFLGNSTYILLLFAVSFFMLGQLLIVFGFRAYIFSTSLQNVMP